MRGVGVRNMVGARRRQLAAAGAVFLVVLAVGSSHALHAFASNSPSRPLDRNISSYVLFAKDSLSFTGFNVNGGIIHGNVGVNHPNGTASMCVNGATTMDAGSQVAADYVTLGTPCKFDTLFVGGATHMLGAGAPSLKAKVIRQPWTNIVPDSALANPAEPKACEGDLRVPDGGYQQIWGDHVYCNVIVGKNAFVDYFMYDYYKTVTYQPRNFWVQGSMKIGDGSTVEGWALTPDKQSVYKVADAHFYVDSVGISSTSNAVTFGRNVQFSGNVSVPNAGINLGNSTTLLGHFWAKDISSDWGVTVGPPPPPPVTTTTTLPTQSTTAPTTAPPTTVPKTTVPPTTTPPTTAPPTTAPPTTAPPTSAPPTTVPPTTAPPTTVPRTTVPTTTPPTTLPGQ
jgi:hypothetical protein